MLRNRIVQVQRVVRCNQHRWKRLRVGVVLFRKHKNIGYMLLVLLLNIKNKIIVFYEVINNFDDELKKRDN